MSKDNNKEVRHLTVDEIRDGCITLYGENDEESKVCMIQEEFRQGINIIKSYDKSVTFYGSAQLKEDHEAYKKAQNIAYRIAKELNFAVLSGGGGGIMEAANRGAYDAGGKSVGLTIKLPHEQITNKYVNEVVPFYFFFARKVSMSYTTDACLFFPGGFGTLDELFEMLTLRQTKKIGEVPIILVGTEFWKPFEKIFQERLVDIYQTVAQDDLKLYTITDDEDEIIKIVASSPHRTGQDSLR